MKNILLSIIVPVYNSEKYLKECLDSLVNQDFDNKYEVILVDDGANDNCSKILDNYCNKFIYFKCFHTTNHGTCGARNMGIRFAQGKYITFFDNDDICTKNMYKNIIEKIEDNDYDALYFSSTDNIEKLTKEYKSNIKIKTQLEKQYIVNVWQTIYRTDIIRNNGILFNEQMIVYGEDILFNIDYSSLITNNKIGVIDDNLYFHRMNKENQSSKIKNEKYKKNKDNLVRLYENLKIILNRIHYIYIYMGSEKDSCYKYMITDMVGSFLYTGLIIKNSANKTINDLNECGFNTKDIRIKIIQGNSIKMRIKSLLLYEFRKEIIYRFCCGAYNIIQPIIMLFKNYEINN